MYVCMYVCVYVCMYVCMYVKWFTRPKTVTHPGTNRAYVNQGQSLSGPTCYHYTKPATSLVCWWRDVVFFQSLDIFKGLGIGVPSMAKVVETCGAYDKLSRILIKIVKRTPFHFAQ